MGRRGSSSSMSTSSLMNQLSGKCYPKSEPERGGANRKHRVDYAAWDLGKEHEEMPPFGSCDVDRVNALEDDHKGSCDKIIVYVTEMTVNIVQ